MSRSTQTAASGPLVSERRRKRNFYLFVIKIVGFSRGVMPISEMAWFSRMSPSPDQVVETIMRNLGYPLAQRERDACEQDWFALTMLMNVGGREIVANYIRVYPDDGAVALEFEYCKLAIRMMSERRDASLISRYSLHDKASRPPVSGDIIADLLFRKFGETR
nr:hypothetical protein TetV2_00120 [Oceanusvirus sp.]